jgi:TonB-linked SusC/RagA family outer membrane protein
MKQKPIKPIPLFKYGIKKALLIISLVMIALMISPVKMNAAGPDSNSGSIPQQVTVTGIIKDENGQPMPGVNIVVEGTSLGSISDITGKYTISVSNSNAVLKFSFIGYADLKVPVAGKTKLDISLEPSASELDEVIVVGYGSQKKKDVTSAIAIVDAKQLKQAPVANITNSLQGLTPGIEVQSNQGRPGELPNIRVRGVSSTSSSTEPLYVIDGIPQDNAYVNPSDVESMQILKDAASSAIYGSRGANGVILITTKSGKTGTPKVSYSGYYGVEKAWKTLDLLNIQQWAEMVTESNTNAGSSVPSLAVDIMKHINTGSDYTVYDGTVTDWQKEIFQTGAITENNLSVSGGTQSGNYFFSVGQYYQDGIIIDTPYKRYTMRMNSDWHSDKFKFGENISFQYSKNEAEDANQGRSVLESTIKITPNIPVYNSDPKYMPGGFSGFDTEIVGHDAENPVGSMLRRSDMNYNKRFMSSFFGERQLYKDLNFRSTFGINSMEYNNRTLQLQTNMTPKAYNSTTLSEQSSWTYNWVWENMMTYHKIFGDHDLTAMGAYTSEYSKYHTATASGNTIQSEDTDVLSMIEAGQGVSGSENETSRISYLGRVMYNYKGRYMFTGNIRRDGSSKFAAGNKWGSFPSASFAWRISDESFMKSIPALSNLKFRTSYGVVGNDAPINAYSYISGLTSGQNYTFGGSKYVGVSVRSFNNPEIKWEEGKQFDVGIDIGLFKGALEATVEYYNKHTSDMIVAISLPYSVGTTSSINKNVGSMYNEGFEFSATHRGKIRDFNYSLTANLATQYNEVLGLYGTSITAGSTEYGSATLTAVGHSVGEFYGYKTVGMFQNTTDVTEYKNTAGVTIQPKAAPGDIKFADLNDDGAITSADRDYIGSPLPKFTYSLTATAQYKGFDLSIFFQGVEGNKIFAELVAWTQGMNTNFNMGTDCLKRWQKEGDITDVPRAIRNDPSGNIKNVSDRYIKDGSYLRLKNVSLGYTLPKRAVDFMKISNLRVYLTGRNLLTFTKYPYYDPEIGSNAQGTGGSTNTSRGIDNGYYPQARTMIMGVQVDF